MIPTKTMWNATYINARTPNAILSIILAVDVELRPAYVWTHGAGGAWVVAFEMSESTWDATVVVIDESTEDCTVTVDKVVVVDQTLKIRAPAMLCQMQTVDKITIHPRMYLS